MLRKLAIDWDESEVRVGAAQCSGSNVKVTDARVIPIEDNVLDTLKAALAGKGMENTETLVAIGRGQAELRELQLPPVPEDELPDMVRFQASKSFATAGDNANVDYLVTNRSDAGVEMIAAALGEQELARIRGICESGSLVAKRISIRPLSAAALYLLKRERSSGNDTVLIDLLSEEAEIVVARDGRVIFVRTVRMPSAEAARGRALAGELKRSLVACGSSGTLERVVLWGQAAVHSQDVEMLAEATDSKVEVLDPFSLVEVDRNTKGKMPEHVGRLAPLVGLLVADETGADRLLDFLNPRKRVEVVESPYRKYLIASVPIAVAALVGFLIYRQLGALDQQIEVLKTTNKQKEKDVKAADVSIARTETVDRYLDSDVNWLNEVRRLAAKAPESDKLIVRSLNAATDNRNGGGRMTVDVAVTEPSVIGEFEAAVRGDSRKVEGDGARDLGTSNQYRWSIKETIKIAPEYVREQRYTGMRGVVEEPGSELDQPESTSENDPVSEREAGGSEQAVVRSETEQSETEQSEALDGEKAGSAPDVVPGQEKDADPGNEGDDVPGDADLPAVGESGKSESGDDPAEGAAGEESETSPEREAEANSDDDVVAEIRTEVKS